MMLETLFPLSLIGILATMFSVHMFCAFRNQSSVEKIEETVAKYITFFFLITYLVLPSVTTTIFGAFQCKNIDPDGLLPDTPTYLLLDMSIPCTGPNSGRYQFGVSWAIAMIIVYPVGVLSIYFYTLWYNHLEIIENDYTPEKMEELLERERILREEYKELHNGSDVGFVMPGRKPPSTGFMKYITAEQLNFLCKAYEGRCWYWEVVETIRRLLLTAGMSIIGNGTAAQIVFGIVVALVYIKLYSFFQPFEGVRRHPIRQIHSITRPFTLIFFGC
jgi:hypothetical protein